MCIYNATLLIVINIVIHFAKFDNSSSRRYEFRLFHYSQ